MIWQMEQLSNVFKEVIVWRIHLYIYPFSIRGIKISLNYLCPWSMPVSLKSFITVHEHFKKKINIWRGIISEIEFNLKCKKYGNQKRHLLINIQSLRKHTSTEPYAYPHWILHVFCTCHQSQEYVWWIRNIKKKRSNI